MNEFVEATLREVRQMSEDGIPQHKILEHLALSAEQLAPTQAVCSILLVDKNGLLRNGASPKLPYDYLTAIDGLKPDPKVGTCAVAAATGEMVITKDFCADNKWAELRHLPLALGFAGAWSMPIKDPQGRVLGTFGPYYREKRTPADAEIDAVRNFADAAAAILGAGLKLASIEDIKS